LNKLMVRFVMNLNKINDKWLQTNENLN
jgi:hypothetical protein